jgi:hypothetical protein
MTHRKLSKMCFNSCVVLSFSLCIVVHPSIFFRMEFASPSCPTDTWLLQGRALAYSV